jgi:hypothetical protein
LSDRDTLVFFAWEEGRHPHRFGARWSHSGTPAFCKPSTKTST